MKYLWSESIPNTKRESLVGDINTNVLVVGGGMAGILIAYFLKQNGINCVVAEAREVGMGVTRGTTAVITAQHSVLYTELAEKFGFEKAKKYLYANLEAVEKFRKIAKEIPCDFEDKKSIMYSKTQKNKMEKEAELVSRMGFPAEFMEKISLPFDIAGAVVYNNMAQFHPLKFILGIASKLKIFENTKVNKIVDNIAYTQQGSIKADKIIIATHFPFINKHGLYFTKLYQKRSYVIALKNAPNFDATFVEDTENGMYLRNYKDLLLIGGGDHRTGKKGEGYFAPYELAKHYFHNTEISYMWATQDCMSLDSVPYIGNYSETTPNLYVATGFNEWGMTSSMIAATVLSDMILKRKNKYAEVFDPSRNMFKKQLFVNLGTTLAHFAIPTTKRCSHLGCALKWNPDERSWDCPCHGSRFKESGEVIDNPAMKKGII